MKMENINPKNADKNYNEKERNFLKEELKRIEGQIKTVKGYSKDNIKYQKELWALRDKIIREIGVIPGNTVIIKQYSEIENKAKNNKNNTDI